jgi:hypothetical protein
VDLQSETSFYRLAMKHTDGNIDYSKVLSLVNRSMGRISLVSNLVSNELQLNFLNQEFNSVEINIYNVEGQNLLSQIPTGNTIEVSWLSPGLYFLRVRKDKAIQTLKFLKI